MIYYALTYISLQEGHLEISSITCERAVKFTYMPSVSRLDHQTTPTVTQDTFPDKIRGTISCGRFYWK